MKYGLSNGSTRLLYALYSGLAFLLTLQVRAFLPGADSQPFYYSIQSKWHDWTNSVTRPSISSVFISDTNYYWTPGVSIWADGTNYGFTNIYHRNILEHINHDIRIRSAYSDFQSVSTNKLITPITWYFVPCQPSPGVFPRPDISSYAAAAWALNYTNVQFYQCFLDYFNPDGTSNRYTGPLSGGLAGYPYFPVSTAGVFTWFYNGSAVSVWDAFSGNFLWTNSSLNSTSAIPISTCHVHVTFQICATATASTPCCPVQAPTGWRYVGGSLAIYTVPTGQYDIYPKNGNGEIIVIRGFSTIGGITIGNDRVAGELQESCQTNWSQVPVPGNVIQLHPHNYTHYNQGWGGGI